MNPPAWPSRVAGRDRENVMRENKKAFRLVRQIVVMLLFVVMVAGGAGVAAAADSRGCFASLAATTISKEKPGKAESTEEATIVIPVKLLKPEVTIFTGLMAVTYKAPEYVKSFTGKIVEAVKTPSFDATR
jgi:hypothetical protein